MQQQQALLGSYPNAAVQQPYGRSVGNSAQQLFGPHAVNGMQHTQQQARPGSPYTEQQARQFEQPLQPSSDRLGITPMQLAMLQQQRMQQNRSPQK